MVQCTSGSLPAGFVAGTIEHHNAGGVDVAFTCQDTIQVPATTSSRGQPRGNCLVVTATSPLCWFPTSIYSDYPGGDSPVLDGSQDEPSCPHCLFGPCIIRRPPVFLTGSAIPSLANDRKRFKLFQQFWQLLKDLRLRDHHIPGKEGIGDAPI